MLNPRVLAAAAPLTQLSSLPVCKPGTLLFLTTSSLAIRRSKDTCCKTLQSNVSKAEHVFSQCKNKLYWFYQRRSHSNTPPTISLEVPTTAFFTLASGVLARSAFLECVTFVELKWLLLDDRFNCQLWYIFGRRKCILKQNVRNDSAYLW